MLACIMEAIQIKSTACSYRSKPLSCVFHDQVNHYYLCFIYSIIIMYRKSLRVSKTSVMHVLIQDLEGK